MLNKILITILLIVAALAFIGRLGAGPRLVKKDQPPPAPSPEKRSGPPAQELVRCSTCGAYVDPREGCRSCARKS